MNRTRLGGERNGLHFGRRNDQHVHHHMYHHYPTSPAPNPSQVHLSIGVSVDVIENSSIVLTNQKFVLFQLRPNDFHMYPGHMRANGASHMRTLSHFVRVIEENDLHRCVRGASQVQLNLSEAFYFIDSFEMFCFMPQETIERNTFPHKYKRVRRQSEIDEDDDGGEKCTICLSIFEIENDVR